MKLMRWFNLLLIVALALAFLPIHTASAAPAAVEIDRNSLYVPGEVVVAFTDGLTASAYGAQANALAGQVGATVAGIRYNTALLSFAEDADVEAAVAEVLASGKVKFAQPNYVSWIPELDSQLMDGSVRYETDGSYSINSPKGRSTVFTRAELASMRSMQRNSFGRVLAIPTFPNEFTFDAFNTQGWDLINTEVIYRDTAATTAVCVLDTGVDANHPDLSGKIINGYDFVNNDTLPADDHGHGTHVAGTITAKGNNGPTTALGISLGRVIAVKVLHAQGWGTSFDIAAGIRFCANRTDSKVINMSLGGTSPDMIEYYALVYAIKTKGKLVVAAAGNSSLATFHFPSSWANKNTTPYEFTDTDPLDDIPHSTWNQDNDLDLADNEIYQGMISVAAARMHPHSIPVWVDTDNNGEGESDWETLYNDPDISGGENYGYADCAAGFTNYGVTTSIVAPGTMIFSTTPKSYAFYMNFYEGVQPVYDYLSGTSMASPHVAAAAARLWSVYKLVYGPPLVEPTNAQIKAKLIETGRPLNFAIDSYDSITETEGFDAGAGFNNQGFGAQDEDEDGIYEFTKAPFCWPSSDVIPVGSGVNPIRGELVDAVNVYADYYDDYSSTWSLNKYVGVSGGEDMSHVTYLDVASAMDRYMTVGGAVDATTTLPLNGATITLQQINPVTKATFTRDMAKLTMMDERFILTNLPAASAASPWRLFVNMGGYTAGNQLFAEVGFDAPSLTTSDYYWAGGVGEDDIYYDADNATIEPFNTWVSVPPNKDIQVVADWWMPGTDIDLYVWLPEASPIATTTSSPGGWVSPGWLTYYQEDYWNFSDVVNPLLFDNDPLTGDPLDPCNGWICDWGTGSLLNPIQVNAPLTTKMPQAQLNHDGGSAYLGGGYWPSDSITIKMKPGTSMPFYPGNYDILVTDYSNNYGGQIPNELAPEFSVNRLNYDDWTFNYPTVRIWYRGVLRVNSELYLTSDPSCVDSPWPVYDWWHVATLNGVLTPINVNQCGTAEYDGVTGFDILPYPVTPGP